MDIITILSFLLTAVLLTIMPGPDNLFVLAQSVVKGKYAGISTSLGLCTGLLVHISAATLGISAIIYKSAIAFSIVKYAGAAYLLFLAYQSFRDKSSPLSLNKKSSFNQLELYIKGMIMNLLNPKVSLFFLALLPQFIDESAGFIPMQMLVYGGIFLIQALILFSLLSVFAEFIGGLLQRNQTIARKMSIIQGALLTFIGLKIAFSK